MRRLPEALERVLRDFCERWGCEVLVFGSWARGEADPTDIDLMLRATREIPDHALAELRWALEEAPLIYRVDIVRYETAPTALRAAAEKEGFLWTPANDST